MNAESQLASAALMIRPVRFESNPLTAESNRFQGKSKASPDEQNAAAQLEFDSLAETLRAAGIEVVIVDDTLSPHTPDSVFPNNWVSFHADGRVVLYPMEADNRRTERRLDIIEQIDTELVIWSARSSICQATSKPAIFLRERAAWCSTGRTTLRTRACRRERSSIRSAILRSVWITTLLHSMRLTVTASRSITPTC